MEDTLVKEKSRKMERKGLEKVTITLKDAMKKIPRIPDFSGIPLADDFILALDLNETGDEQQYLVLESGITGFEASLEVETKDSAYLRAGKSTTKTGIQRTFKFDGDYYSGDTTIQKILDLKFELGDSAITDYIYLNGITGEGEKGKVTIIVNKDGGGKATENAVVEFEFKKVGAMPEKYKYTEPEE